MDVLTLLLLIWMHFIADFLFQSKNINMYKFEQKGVLFIHCMLYSIPFFWFGWLFALITGGLHFVIDYTVPILARKYWNEKDYLSFLASFSFDQITHITLIVLTYEWLKPIPWWAP